MHCLASKQDKVAFKTFSLARKSNVLDLIYSDVCGPLKIKTLGGASYFGTFIDNHSRKVWVYILKSKDQVLDVFKQFLVSVEREIGRSLKCIRTNNGGEYKGPFNEYCTNKVIRHQYTPPKTLQHNGVAERINHTIVEKVRCMLSHAKLPRSFWGEAVRTTTNLINLSPSI